jgi:pimeloyl-ACP methyl ester carboxylesterase
MEPAMNTSTLFRKLFGVGAGATLTLAAGVSLAQPEGTPMPEGIRWGSEINPELGVEVRTYTFEETGEQLPYAVFKSSKIKPGEKAPLVVALRGFTGTTLTIVRGTAVDLAEEGGYILVGAIGYNNRAGFGVPPRAPRPPADTAATGAAPAPAARPMPPLVGGSAETDPAKVTAYSEKDVMNVLAMVREEFDIDANRIYLMGHSQGGGGARHLAEKYPDIWAGVALLAPALFDIELSAESRLLDIPVMLAVGDKDTLVEGTQNFAKRLEALNADTVEYKLYEGLDHGTIILGSMREVFHFFGEHSK